MKPNMFVIPIVKKENIVTGMAKWGMFVQWMA